MQRFIIPDIENIRISSEKAITEHPLRQAVLNVKFNKKGPSSTPKTDEKSIGELYSKTSMVEYILIGESVLAANVKKLEAAKLEFLITGKILRTIYY